MSQIKEVSRKEIINFPEPNNIEVLFSNEMIGIYHKDGTIWGYYKEFGGNPKGCICFGSDVLPEKIKR